MLFSLTEKYTKAQFTDSSNNDNSKLFFTILKNV